MNSFEAVTIKYLDPSHPDAFVHFPELAAIIPQYEGIGLTARCPLCHGHGGWNLQLNAYPLKDRPNTSENRHAYSHFKSSCFNCNGWGWVHPEDGDHVHEFDELSQEECRKANISHFGRYYHVYKCRMCNKTRAIDSSD